MSQAITARFAHAAAHRFSCSPRHPRCLTTWRSTQCRRCLATSSTPRRKSRELKSSTTKSAAAGATVTAPPVQPRRVGRPRKDSIGESAATKSSTGKTVIPRPKKNDPHKLGFDDIFAPGEVSEFRKAQLMVQAQAAADNAGSGKQTVPEKGPGVEAKQKRESGRLEKVEVEETPPPKKLEKEQEVEIAKTQRTSAPKKEPVAEVEATPPPEGLEKTPDIAVELPANGPEMKPVPVDISAPPNPHFELHLDQPILPERTADEYYASGITEPLGEVINSETQLSPDSELLEQHSNLADETSLVRYHSIEAYPHYKPSSRLRAWPAQGVPGRRDLKLEFHLPENFQDSNPLTLYLPFHTPNPRDSIFQTLSTATSTGIVLPTYPTTIRDPPFPVYLHDAVAALRRTRTLFPRSPIGVFGSGLSGGLALALAITESSVPESAFTVAAAHNPITNLFTLGSVTWNKALRQWQPASLESPASVMREEVFGPNPFWWTDSFASPLFFLRTPGVAIEEEEGKGVQKLRSHVVLKLEPRLAAKALVGYDVHSRDQGARECGEFVRLLKRAWAVQFMERAMREPEIVGDVEVKEAVRQVREEMVTAVDTGDGDGVQEVAERLGAELRLAEKNMVDAENATKVDEVDEGKQEEEENEEEEYEEEEGEEIVPYGFANLPPRSS